MSANLEELVSLLPLERVHGVPEGGLLSDRCDDDLKNHLRRFLRVLNGSRTVGSVYSAESISALLAAISGSCDLRNAGGSENRGAREKSRSDIQRLMEFLSAVSVESVPSYLEIPMSAEECKLEYRNLLGLEFYLSEEGVSDFTDAIRLFIEEQHPFCHELLPGVAAHAQKALVAFPCDDDLARNVRGELPWASVESLTHILEAAMKHVREHH